MQIRHQAAGLADDVLQFTLDAQLVVAAELTVFHALGRDAVQVAHLRRQQRQARQKRCGRRTLGARGDEAVRPQQLLGQRGVLRHQFQPLQDVDRQELVVMRRAVIGQLRAADAAARCRGIKPSQLIDQAPGEGLQRQLFSVEGRRPHGACAEEVMDRFQLVAPARAATLETPDSNQALGRVGGGIRPPLPASGAAAATGRVEKHDEECRWRSQDPPRALP